MAKGLTGFRLETRGLVANQRQQTRTTYIFFACAHAFKDTSIHPPFAARGVAALSGLSRPCLVVAVLAVLAVAYRTNVMRRKEVFGLPQAVPGSIFYPPPPPPSHKLMERGWI